MKKGIIISAGFGSRMLPISASVPKEMLPINSLPCLHHVCYEMMCSGIKEIRIVISHEKNNIKNYFEMPMMPKDGYSAYLINARNELLDSVKISFCYQEELNGSGGAILSARDFIANDQVLVAYPDDLLYCWDNNALVGFDGDGVRAPATDITTARLIRTAESTARPALLTSIVKGNDAHNYGIITAKNNIKSIFQVQIIQEKPLCYGGETACVFVGRFVIDNDVLSQLSKLPQEDKTGVIPALNYIAREKGLDGVVHYGGRYDIGNFIGYAGAVHAFAN